MKAPSHSNLPPSREHLRETLFCVLRSTLLALGAICLLLASVITG